ncbi:trypsin-like peptidase domain-containing protein [Neotabrizicola sp. VNH66]|uniref:S1C family serine protease n=1 Tax=Neotabrizicola sp. VNH66 TaxID=3400918 RepID=UPI003C0D79A0
MTTILHAARLRLTAFSVTGLLVASGLCAAPAAADTAVLESTMDAVLVVRSNDAEDTFLGSAFLWGEVAEVAVTNAHVVGEAEEVRLIDRHGNEEVGEVIAIDAVRDVAVIALADRGTPRRGLVPAEAAATLGQEVYALGAPLGIEFTLTEGLVSSTARQVQITVPMTLLQHDAAVNPGSSGGPLVDAEGRLLGMNSRIADGSRMFVGIAYAIPAGDLDRIVTGLIDETLTPFPKLGLSARSVDRKVAEALDVTAAGLLVDNTAPGSLAAAAGLAAGDIILAVDGGALAQAGDFVFAVERALDSGKAVLTVLRDGAEVELVMDFAPVLAEEADGGLRIRDLSGMTTEPAKVKSYRLGALGIVLGEEGAVTDVTLNSPALSAGLVKGDRILSVNGQTMDTAALAALEITGPALVLVQAPGGQTRHIYLDPWGSADGVRPLGGANVLDPAVVVF